MQNVEDNLNFIIPGFLVGHSTSKNGLKG